MGIYVWGTGCGASELLEQGLELERICGFVDSYPCADTFLGKPVLLPEKLPVHDCNLLIITTRHAEQIAKRCEELSVRMGMEYLSGKCERVYLMHANYPLITPDTMQKLKETEGSIVVPVCSGKRGQPLLVSSSFSGEVSVASVMTRSDLQEVSVDDMGILLTAAEANQHKDLIAAHEQKLTRLIPDFSITRGKPLVDGKLVALLRLIRETQSVRDACNRMQISYSTAWNLLNVAEDALGYPLVSRNKGGPSGCGSLLTEKGQSLLTACDQFETAARENLECLCNQFLESIL